MLIDTHCHLNMIVKQDFDTPLSDKNLQEAQLIIEKAEQEKISTILNVGTSLVESYNSIALAKHISGVYAAIGIHPNDLNENWRQETSQLADLLHDKIALKIKAIGECGIDLHYPDYNLTKQQDAFKMQIELALEHNLPLVVHSRDAEQETLRCLEEFKDTALKGVIHCFSYGLDIAQEAIKLNFLLGIDGPITYPKNNLLRAVVSHVGLDHIVLETDAPFLPPQIIRGKQNSPKYIKVIAQYIAELLNIPFEQVAQKTTYNAEQLFSFSN